VEAYEEGHPGYSLLHGKPPVLRVESQGPGRLAEEHRLGHRRRVQHVGEEGVEGIAAFSPQG
jgi:hypothetical protein